LLLLCDIESPGLGTGRAEWLGCGSGDRVESRTGCCPLWLRHGQPTRTPDVAYACALFPPGLRPGSASATGAGGRRAKRLRRRCSQLLRRNGWSRREGVRSRQRCCCLHPKFFRGGDSLMYLSHVNRGAGGGQRGNKAQASHPLSVRSFASGEAAQANPRPSRTRPPRPQPSHSAMAAPRPAIHTEKRSGPP